MKLKQILIIGLLIILTILTNSCNMRGRKNGNNNNINDKVKMEKVIHLNKADFLEKVVNFEKNPDKWNYLGDKPSIIDFYADWCGPCKMLSPILEELAEKYEGQIHIYKINTETEAELANAFNIRSIPTILFCPMNGDPQMAQGMLPKETLEKAIKEVLLGE